LAFFALDPLGRFDPYAGQDYQGYTMVFDRFHLRQAERTFGARSEFLRLLIHPKFPSASRFGRITSTREGAQSLCVRLLEPWATEVVRIGGSGAQARGDTLIVALIVEKARNLLDRRLHHHPSPCDAAWRAQLAT
jgi:hypothetical protein